MARVTFCHLSSARCGTASLLHTALRLVRTSSSEVTLSQLDMVWHHLVKLAVSKMIYVRLEGEKL